VRLNHVGINAVFLDPPMGGLEVLVRSLIPALVRTAPGLRISVFVNPDGGAQLAREPWAGEVDLVTRPWLGRRPFRALSELTLLGALAPRQGVQLLHSVAMTAPLLTRAVSVVSINDVIWLTDPTPDDRVTNALWRMVGPPAARRADRVIAISAAGKQAVVERLRVKPDRIDVVYPGHGVEQLVAPTPEPELRRRLGLGRGPLLLTVSAKRAHKNLARLLRALVPVSERFPEIVLALPGRATPYEQSLKRLAGELGITRNVAFLDYVGDADLEGLYAAARCFVFPSLNEGFGLPVQEAQRRGVPVACSNASALPEAAGKGARFFDPHSEGEMAAAVLELLEDRAVAERLVAAGRDHQAAFTWERAAEGTLEVYERAASERRA
jgi:glycosyltransferase involved in cell wall biosynthesis